MARRCRCGTGAGATGGQGVEDILACARIAEDAARWACYDRTVDGYNAAQAKIAAARKEEQERLAAGRRAAEAAAQAQASVEAFGADSLPSDVQAAARGAEAGKELTVAIVEMGRNPSGKFFIVTDTGQVWRQTDSETMPFDKAMKAAVIKRGAISRYRLTFPEIRRTYRVMRVR